MPSCSPVPTRPSAKCSAAGQDDHRGGHEQPDAATARRGPRSQLAAPTPTCRPGRAPRPAPWTAARRTRRRSRPATTASTRVSVLRSGRVSEYSVATPRKTTSADIAAASGPGRVRARSVLFRPPGRRARAPPPPPARPAASRCRPAPGWRRSCWPAPASTGPRRPGRGAQRPARRRSARPAWLKTKSTAYSGSTASSASRASASPALMSTWAASAAQDSRNAAPMMASPKTSAASGEGSSGWGRPRRAAAPRYVPGRATATAISRGSGGRDRDSGTSTCSPDPPPRTVENDVVGSTRALLIPYRRSRRAVRRVARCCGR